MENIGGRRVLAAQRIATPIVHIAQHTQAAPNAGFAVPRNFGIE
jgi:hypothetical protein